MADTNNEQPTVTLEVEAPQGGEPTPKPAETLEINDDIALAYLKKKGIKVDSFDDLIKPAPKTAEELEKEQKAFNDEAIAWGLKSEKIKREDYDKSVILKNKSSLDIAFEAYFAEQKAEDKTLTAETAREMFEEEYHLTKDEGSLLRKNGLKSIEKIANEIRQSVKAVDELPTMYKEYQTSAAQRREVSKTIRAIADQMPDKFEYVEPATDNQPEIKVEIPIDKDDIQAIVKQWDSDFIFNTLFDKGKKAISPELLKEQLQKELEKSIPTKRWMQAIKSHGEKMAKEERQRLANSGFGRQSVNGQTTQKAPASINAIEEATRLVSGAR
jgi:hypothetical protein